MIWADDSLFVCEPAWSQGLNARAPMIYLHNYCIFRFAHNEQQRMILGLHKNQLSLLCWAREMLRTGVRRGAVSQYYPDNPSFKGYTFPLQIGKVGTDCEAQKHLSRDNQASLLCAGDKICLWVTLSPPEPGTGRRPVTRRSLPAWRSAVSREWAQSAAETRAGNIRQQVRTEDIESIWSYD